MDLWAFGLGLLIIFAIGIFVIKVSKYHKCKFDAIKDDGFQYCSKCGKASRPLPKSCPPSKPCQHKWELFKEQTVLTNKDVTGTLYILKCKFCGDLKSYRTDVRS